MKGQKQPGIRFLLLLFFFILSLSACSTVYSNYGIHEPQVGNVYSGVSFNIYSWRCYARTVPDNPGLLVFAPFVIPFMIIDLPLSAVGDTVHLPIDVAASAKHQRIEPTEDDCALHWIAR